jgi:hypothetical protein
VGETTAQDASQSIPNLLIRGIRFYVEYGLRRQDHVAKAKPALGGSFLNLTLAESGEAFQACQALLRRDFVLTDRAYRHNTRPHDLAADDYSAGCALRHATSESGSAQLKLVVQNKQQRRFSVPI